MLLSDISVKRPVFAAVISMLLVAFGVLSYQSLQVREYPDVTSPVLSVSASYPGASAAVMETQVTQVLEDAISGIEGIKTINSRSNDGSSRINIEFDLHRDIDEAANDVRDRVSRTQRELPDEVLNISIRKQDSDASPIVWLSISSPNLPPLELRDYVDRYLRDQFAILPGVSQVSVGGVGAPAIRIWLDRLELAARGLTVTDVENALRRENLELPAGRLDSDAREFPVRVERGYTTEEDFERLVIATGDDGHLIRLSEVAQIERGAEDLRDLRLTNGATSVSMSVTKQSTANTVEVMAAVNETIDRLNNELPAGMHIERSSDASVFINAAIDSVYTTIIITTLLVGLVIYLFLGSFRTMIIPMITVPVCLIASFIVLNALGMSVNLITLLALVLSIGLVVDDSIVVLENVHRRIEDGEPPLVAAFRGTRQVGFAVIATTAVVVAVFTPILFLTDQVGLLFAELAATVCAAVIFSSVLALSLAPMLCSKVLKAHHGEREPMVDRVFNWLGDRYEDAIRGLLPVSWIAFPTILFVGFSVFILSGLVEREFAPQEDQRVFFANISAPEGTSFTRMASKVDDILDPILPLYESGDIDSYTVSIPSWFSPSPNAAIVMVTLAPWGESDLDTESTMWGLVGQWNQIPDLRSWAFMRSGLSGGSGTQIQFVLQGTDFESLARYRDIVLAAAADYPGITDLDSDLRETQSQVIVEVDKERAAALGISAQAVGRTLQTMMSEREVSTYEVGGEEYSIIMQARDDQRASPEDLRNIFVRSESTRELVPLSNLISIRNEAGIGTINRYNRLRAVTLSGSVAPGYSLGDALDFLNQVVDQQLPAGVKVDYKGESLEYQDASNQIYFTFGIALLVLFFVMAAQFESFVHPVVILFTVPLAVAGAFLGMFVSGASFNIYSQIGVIMLIGIASKNGILIVEFINQIRDEGVEFRDAIVKACRIRFRPVVMTTMSTIMGSIPLLLAGGPGSESRFVLGVVIFSGVSIASVLTLFLVPLVYERLARNTGSPNAVAHELERLQAQTA